MKIEDVTVEHLLNSRLIKAAAAKPKADATDERRRQDTIAHAKFRYLKNVTENIRLKERMSLMAECAQWFEVFNGVPMLDEESAIMGMDDFAFKYNVVHAIDHWKNRAKLAAMRKGKLAIALRDCTLGRMRRILRIQLQTPDWVDFDKIKEFYVLRDRMNVETGIVHHVDHVIPLAAKKATGFHVHDNLQVITAAENMEKLARFDGWEWSLSC